LETPALEVDPTLVVESPPSDEPAVLDGSDLPGLDNDDDDVLAVPELDRSTPEFKAFAEQFKQMVGVDLTEAMQRYEALTTLHEETVAMRSEVAAIEARRNLQTAWAVNDVEFERRVDTINKYAAKYPDVVAKYDTLDGLQVLWDKLSSSKRNKAGTGASDVPANAKRYSAADLRKLMTTDVTAYKAIEADVAKAYAEGRVDP
jgi:hypothetical protein